MDNFPAVRKVLYDARDKWEPIGEELGLKRSDLKHLTGNNYQKLGHVVEMWLTRSQLNPTWQSFARALREPPVDRDDIADEIESKHLGTSTRKVRCWI